MIKTVYKVKVEGANRYVGFRPTAAKDRFEIVVIYFDKINNKWYCYVLAFFDLKDGKMMEPEDTNLLLEENNEHVSDAYYTVVRWIKDHQEIIAWDCSWYEKGVYEEDVPVEALGSKAAKNDFLDDKLRWDLLPMEEIEDIVKVYHFGAKKYAPGSWKNLENGFERYRAAGLRHLMAYMKGERYDKESGCHHLAQAAWNAIALLWYDKHGKGLMPLDDGEKKEESR